MINGARIRQIRELRGLTQIELAESIGVTQATIAYIEGGRSEPTEDNLNAIALKTGFPPAFFRRETTVNFPLGSLLFRARSSVTSGEKLEAYRYAQILFELAETLLSKVQWRSSRLPRINIDPIEAAKHTRSALGLSPDTPIDHLINIVEKSGVLILVVPILLQGRDAFSGWAGAEMQRPVIIITSGTSSDRLRFSVAHELGHLVMHQPLMLDTQHKVAMRDIESQADQFASEFLMPELVMKQEITLPVTLSSLAELKVRWRVSIQSLIKRSYDLEIITERQYRYLYQQLTARGWRKVEPINIPLEKPRLLHKVVEMLYGSPINYSKIASDVNLTPQLVRQVLGVHLSQEEIKEAENERDSDLMKPLPFSNSRRKES